jgi:NitT/TauT family transport system substrate-binding protein
MNRHHFRSTTYWLAAWLLLGASAACAPDRPLRLAIHPWIGYETLYLAREFEWLRSSVTLYQANNLGDSVAALRAGAVDAAALTLDEVLLAREQGVPLVVVMVFNVSAGADALLARPPIAAVSELRGRRVAVENSALGPIVLAQALATAGMSIDDVVRIDLPPDRQPSAWRGGDIDAAVSYGPALRHLEALGALRLFDSREMPEGIIDVLAVRRNRLHHPGVLAAVEAHFRALDHLRHSREDAIYRIAARQGIAVADVERDLAGIALPEARRNLAMLQPGATAERAAQLVRDAMVEHDLLPPPADLGGLFVDDILRRSTGLWQR